MIKVKPFEEVAIGNCFLPFINYSLYGGARKVFVDKNNNNYQAK